MSLSTCRVIDGKKVAELRPRIAKNIFNKTSNYQVAKTKGISIVRQIGSMMLKLKELENLSRKERNMVKTPKE